jgi:Family of unknown function (DUF6527)
VKARWIGTDVGSCADLPQPGDIAIGAENYHDCLMVKCPICHRLHVVDIIGSTYPNPRWKWDQSTLTMVPSLRVGPYDDGTICHWNLTNGEFIIHSDSTAKPPIA